MRILLRLLVFAVAIVLSVSAAGCGSQAEQGTGVPSGERDTEGAPDGGGVPGVPGNEDPDEEVPVSPIDIPEITISQGQPVDDVRARLETELIKRCGGTLCVKLIVEQRNDSFTICQFDTTDPAPGTQVKRGSVVVIVTGTQPCESESEPTPDESVDSGETTPDEAPTDNGETASEGGETSLEGETPSD